MKKNNGLAGGHGGPAYTAREGPVGPDEPHSLPVTDDLHRSVTGADGTGPPPAAEGRFLDAIPYVKRTGIPWRYFPHDYPQRLAA